MITTVAVRISQITERALINFLSGEEKSGRTNFNWNIQAPDEVFIGLDFETKFES